MKCAGTLAMGSVVAVLAGCSIIPGMHVSVGGGDVSQTKTISDSEEIRYFESNAGAIGALRIVTLNPRNIVEIAGAAPEASPLKGVTPGGPPAEYQLGSGDVVNVIVWDHPELTNPTGEFRDPVSAGRLIDTQGMMFYPFIGSFKATGMTTTQLRDFIQQKLASVITRPQVDVRVVAFRSQRVQISGEVRQPGAVTLDDTTKGLIEAIGERGGFTENASRRRVEITRDGRLYDLDLGSVLRGTSASPNPLLMPGDMIHVPDRSEDQVFVLGEVNKEGPVFLQQQRTTLTEILANAGGINHTGSNDAGVLVFRRPGKDKVATVYRASLSDAVGLLTAGEFALEPRDVVYVSSTNFSQYNAIINQLLPTISAVFQVDALARSHR